MPAKSKPTISKQIFAMPSGPRWQRLVHWTGMLRDEIADPQLLDDAETIALAKKLLNRALKQNHTRAEVEAFLRG